MCGALDLVSVASEVNPEETGFTFAEVNLFTSDPLGCDAKETQRWAGSTLRAGM